MVVFGILFAFFFFKQKTAYEMRISDWSSDVCSSDLQMNGPEQLVRNPLVLRHAVRPRLILERLIGREEGIEDDFLRHDADRIFGVARIGVDVDRKSVV